MALDDQARRRLGMGAVIRLWRDRIRHMTQTELEEKAGLSKNRVSRYESGQDLPEADQLEKIAKALGVEAVELQDGAKLISHHLQRGLGPFEAAPSSDEIAESRIPDDLLLAWDRQLKAESDVARARVHLEYESQHRAPTGEPRRGRA